MTAVGLIADDLTGACDSALPFLAMGPVRVGIWPHMPDAEVACMAVSTESRAESASVAYDRSREAAARLRCDLVYRKLDSLLRGNAVADLAGVLTATGISRCVVAPALPGEGRTTAGGVQRWPGGEEDLSALFATLAGRVEVRDAASDADLDRIAHELLARGDGLAAGTAGLPPHWPGRWAWGRHQPQHRPGARGPWPWSAASRQRARPSTPAPEAGPSRSSARAHSPAWTRTTGCS